MFLDLTVYFPQIVNNDTSVFSWIENHSVTVGVVSALVVGSLWYWNFLRQKRAEAFFGFYTRLLLQIKSLYKWLDEKQLLDVKDVRNGNIFTLAYSPDVLDKVCDGFHNVEKDDPDQFEVLVNLANQLKGTLLQTECNVYPKRSNKQSWYNSQHILLEFCYFVIEKGRRGERNKYSDTDEVVNNTEGLDGVNVEFPNSDVYFHIAKCKELIAAMEKLQEYIKKANY